MIDVREERPGDVAAIRDLNRQAFGQDQEANIVDALRANDGVLLSLVATIDGRVIGHILYSPVQLGALTGAGLGPMAVHPDHQRQGVGRRLIEAGTRRLENSDCAFIVVVGHADYYPRFGFTSARPLGITCEWDVPDDVFLVLVLDSIRMNGVSGPAKYRSEFAIVL
jgi:putative acetyltransferase